MTSTEETWKSWLCDLELEDYSFINSIEGSFPSPEEHNLLSSFSSDNSHSKTENSNTMSNSSGDVNSFERPSKTLKTFPSNNVYTSQMKDPHILAFNNEENQESMLMPKGNKVVNQKKEPKRNIQESKETDSLSRSPNQHHDHIIAERKRREKISQQFIALSALIPGLKKVDKASVLGDAIKHVKQLQEQVKQLEVKNLRKGVESVVYVEKSKSSSDNDVSVTWSNSRDNTKNRSMPEVEARVSKKNVLIRIHCEKDKGVLMNIIREIENLHLSVTNSSTLLFGTSKLDITIIAEMEEKFSLSVQEVARSIRMAVLQFM